MVGQRHLTKWFLQRSIILIVEHGILDFREEKSFRMLENVKRDDEKIIPYWNLFVDRHLVAFIEEKNYFARCTTKDDPDFDKKG